MSQYRDAPYWVHSQPDDEKPDPAIVENVDQATARISAELEDACPGECNHRWRRQQQRAVVELQRSIVARRIPDQRIIRGPLTAEQRAPVWCRSCADEIASTTARLPDVAAAVGRRRDGRLAAPPPTERRAPAVAPPSPSPAWDQVDLIVAFAVSYADRHARQIGLPDPIGYHPSGLPAPDLTGVTRWLVGHRSSLLAAPYAQDYGRELRSLVYRSEKVGGIDRLVHRLKDRCFVCDRRDLKRADGKGQVVCGSCGRSWEWELFEFLAKAATTTQPPNRDTASALAWQTQTRAG